MPEIKYQSKGVPALSLQSPQKFDYPTPTSKFSFGTEAETFNILAQTMQSLAESAKVFYEADQNNKLANAKMGASEELYNYEQSLVGRTDYDNWVPELDKLKTGVKDRWSKGLNKKSQQQFDLFFQSAYEQTGMKATVQQFKKTKEKVEGDYIRRRAFRIAEYGGADETKRAFLENQQFEDTANMAQWMGEDWAANEDVKFQRDAETSAMMEDAFNDPDNFNAYDMDRYRLVEPDTRARIQQSAETRRVTLQNKLIHEEDRQRRLEEHELKMRRDDYYRDIYSEYFLGNDISAKIKQGVEERLLDVSDLENIWKLNRDGITDRTYESQLVRRIILGRGDLESVTYEIVHSDKLSGEDKVTLMKSASTYYGSNDISKNVHYRTAAEDIEKNLTVTAPGSAAYAEGENANIRAALEEFDRRVRAGESIPAVRNDVLQVYRPTSYRELKIPKGMAPPIYGSVHDLKHARDETIKAHKRGDFTDEGLRRELENIGRLQQHREERKKLAEEQLGKGK